MIMKEIAIIMMIENKKKLDRLLHLERQEVTRVLSADELTEQNQLYQVVLNIMNRMERE